MRGQLALEYGGRRVAITCSHMSLDVHRVSRLLLNDEVQSYMIQLREENNTSGKAVFAGCDSIERLSGIPMKFLAFHQYLLQNSEVVERVTLVQIGISCPSRPRDYNESLQEISKLVESINEYHYPHQVIQFHVVNSYSFPQRLALWRVANVQISTVLRDGLNTMPLEFIAAHRYVLNRRRYLNP